MKNRVHILEKWKCWTGLFFSGKKFKGPWTKGWWTVCACCVQDHLLQWMQISVSEPEKRTGNSSVKQETYVVYLIECKYALFFRSTSESRPNNIRGGGTCPSVRPSVRPYVHKKFLRFQWNLVYR